MCAASLTWHFACGQPEQLEFIGLMLLVLGVGERSCSRLMCAFPPQPWAETRAPQGCFGLTMRGLQRRCISVGGGGGVAGNGQGTTDVGFDSDRVVVVVVGTTTGLCAACHSAFFAACACGKQRLTGNKNNYMIRLLKLQSVSKINKLLREMTTIIGVLFGCLALAMSKFFWRIAGGQGIVQGVASDNTL
jgi:hypothetical protein